MPTLRSEAAPRARVGPPTRRESSANSARLLVCAPTNGPLTTLPPEVYNSGSDQDNGACPDRSEVRLLPTTACATMAGRRPADRHREHLAPATPGDADRSKRGQSAPASQPAPTERTTA